MEENTAKCSEEGCVESSFNEEHALAQGWTVVENELFCPAHEHQATRRATAAVALEAMRARIAELRRDRNQREASYWLSTTDYAEWDKFQQELVNFHRNHGKLAPKALRLLGPREWHAVFTKNGAIDVEAEAVVLQEAEERENKTRNWLMGRL